MRLIKVFVIFQVAGRTLIDRLEIDCGRLPAVMVMYRWISGTVVRGGEGRGGEGRGGELQRHHSACSPTLITVTNIFIY